MTTNVLDHGFVRLVDHMPRENLDASIVQSARVSYGEGTKTTRGDEGLIRYLMRHWHTTPFEMVEFKFHIKMPLYIARQHMRHRTASVNELSARYSVVPRDYYVPETLRAQGTTNRQGSEGIAEEARTEDMRQSIDQSFEVYESLLASGVCREQARGALSQSMYTEFYWKINLHNLMHYLRLRMDEHAQEEIRAFARAIHDLVEPLAPVTMRAFKDFRLDAVTLTGPEIECIRTGVPIASPGERREYEEKMARLKIV